MNTKKKYIDKDDAILDAIEFSKGKEAVDVVQCFSTNGFYLDESPTMIRNWEKLVGTAEKGRFTYTE